MNLQGIGRNQLLMLRQILAEHGFEHTPADLLRNERLMGMVKRWCNLLQNYHPQVEIISRMIDEGKIIDDDDLLEVVSLYFSINTKNGLQIWKDMLRVYLA